MSNLPNPYSQLSGNIQRTYDEAQIRQAIAIYEVFLNSGGTIPVSIGNSAIPAVKTPNYTTTSTSGVIAAGAVSVAIANTGSMAGQIQNHSLPPNTSVSWDAPVGSTLASISYDATGTTFSISTLV